MTPQNVKLSIHSVAYESAWQCVPAITPVAVIRVSGRMATNNVTTGV
ncbi:hypothetical protein L4C36_05670 [Photobacterium japonica]